MNLYMQQNQQRVNAKQTNLMSKSRQNYQSGSYSRISNRYDSIEDSLTEDDPADAYAKPQQIGDPPIVQTMLNNQRQLNCDSLDSKSNLGTMSWQASPPSNIFQNNFLSKGNSPAIQLKDGQMDLNNCYFSQVAPGISATLSSKQLYNLCEGGGFVCGTGSFENNSLSPKGRDSFLSSQQIRRQIVELDDQEKFFQNHSSGKMKSQQNSHVNNVVAVTTDEDEENVSDDDDEPKQVKVLQEIPAVMCMDASVLNTRRDSAMYSFTKNIDYSQITDQQKRRFLREKKSYAKNFKKLQQIVPDPSSVKSSMTAEEKENQVCSEFTAQNVKFVSGAQPNFKNKSASNEVSVSTPTEYKPKSILKPSNNGANKTCIQNNVYQSAQFVSKPKQYNYRKKSLTKGKSEAVPGHMNHHANIEILDQKQAQMIQKTKRQPENFEMSRKGSNLESERSGSKKNWRSSNTAKFTYPVQCRKDSKSKIENKRPSQIKRKSSPTAPADTQGSGSYPTSGRRGSTKSTQEAIVSHKFNNYDPKAHRNYLDQFGKKESVASIHNRKPSGNNPNGQRKKSARFNGSSQGMKSPRDNSNQNTSNKQANEAEKRQIGSNKNLQPTIKLNHQSSKTIIQKKQKSLDRTSKIAGEKSDVASASLTKMKSMPSGNISQRDTNSIVERPKSKSKLNQQNTANTHVFHTSHSEQSLSVSKTFNRNGEHKSLGTAQNSLKMSRPSLPTTIHTNGQPKLSVKSGNQTQKFKSIIQIDLVDKQNDSKGGARRQRQQSNHRSKDFSGQATPPVDPSLLLKGKVASHESSSCQDDLRTARGSAIDHKEDKEKKVQTSETASAKIEDPQQEKFKIWMMHSVNDDQNEASPRVSKSKKNNGAESVSDPFRHPGTDTKFTLSESDEPLIQKTTVVDPIDRSLEKSDIELTTETDLKLQMYDSMNQNPTKLLKVENTNQKNQLGPQRASKINRRSKKLNSGAGAKEGQVSVQDIQINIDENLKPVGQSASINMDNDEFEELQLQQTKKTNREIQKEEKSQRVVLTSQEEPKNPSIDGKNGDDKETTLNHTYNERTIRQDLLLEAKSGGVHEQSLSEITQFNQRDFLSSNLDDTNVQNGQSRNISTTNPSGQRIQTHSTIHRTQGSPDIKPTSQRVNGASKPVTATPSTPLQDENIMMKNERCSDLLMNTDVAAQETRVQTSSAEQVLEAMGYGPDKDHYNQEQSNIALQVQSPQFGGLNNRVDQRPSLPNSGRQSIPNDQVMSSSCLDSTRTMDEDGLGQNNGPQPTISQYSICNKHEGNCKCNECFSKLDQIQQKIDQIPFEIYGAPNSHRSNSTQKVSFEALLEQHLILQQIRDLIEIRPSTVQNYSNQKSSFLSSNGANSGSLFDTIPCTQAIEALTVEERIKIQTLCQEWWDNTQEDTSVFKMALAYQQDVQESYFRSSLQDQVLAIEERNLLNSQNYERSQCMRKQVVLSSVVIGMTAFFSMLTRQGKKDSTIVSSDSTVKQDLELRTRLSQLIKILYDQQMLCMSYALGKLAKYDRVTKNRNSAEYKLHSIYNEYIHLLFINKKIQTEDDYQIFNHRSLLPQYPPEQYINNEENRDFQLSQLSRRLQENCFRIVEQELQTQQNASNSGNVDLLLVLRDIVEHSADIDFQEGKNHIFEGISNSEALLSTNNVSQVESVAQDEGEEEGELIQLGGPTEKEDSEEQKAKESAVQEMRAACQEAAGSGGHLLVKTFKDDINQIIQEESREESMSVSVSMINSSKIPPDAEGMFSQSVSHDRSRMQRHGRTPKQVCYDSAQSQETHCGDMQQDFDRMIEIQENIGTEQSKKYDEGTYDSVDKSKTLKLDDTDLRVQEVIGTCSLHNISNDHLYLANDSASNSQQKMKKYVEVPQYVRVSTTNSSIEGTRSKAPFLPPMGPGKKYTLVLDLEETLIHSTMFSKRVSKTSYMQEGEEDLLVYQRPGLQQFLKEMSSLFEIVIFTSKGEECSNLLVQRCIGMEYVDHVLHADHLTIINKHEISKINNTIDEYYKTIQICSSKFGSSYFEPCDQSSMIDYLNTSEGGPTIQMASPNQPSIVPNIASNDINLVQEEKGNYIKDLSKIGRDLSKTIIVDNRAENFGWHLQNGICITEYIFDRLRKANNDQSLQQLGQFLKKIHNQAESHSSPEKLDLRSILGEHLQQRRDMKQNKYFY